MSIQAPPQNDPLAEAAKSIFSSKTMWANLLAPVFLWAATKYGLQLDAETQGEVIMAVIAAMNLALRFVTKAPVYLVKPGP